MSVKAIFRLLKRKKTRLKSKNEVLAGILVAAFFSSATWFISILYYQASFQVSSFLGILVFLIVLWTNSALPLGVVSLLPIVLFPAFGILDVKSATSNYANPIVFLFLGGFMLATAVEKIGLHKIIAKSLLSRFPKTPKGIITAFGTASVILGSALSNSTVALLLVPIALSITEDNVLKTRFLLAVAFGASISGITTPIGTPPNLIFLGFLETTGLGSISFVGWMLLMLPLSISMLYVMIQILSYKLSKEELKIDAFDDITITFEHKKLLFFIFLLLIILLLNSPIKPIYQGLGFNENVILLAFGLLMFIPKIGLLSWEDSRSIPYEIIFLFGAGFCVAMAISKIQLGDAFAPIFAYFSTLPLLLFILCVCFFVLFLTMFISSTALSAILLSVLYASTKEFLEPNYQSLIMLIATICIGFSFLLPFSTPPNAIVANRGNIKPLVMFKFGSVLSIFGIILIVIFSLAYWQWFL
ncbi:MAG TPA: anion permease [Campylobacter avium]|uniref:SLC13 family permease n=1 Tax=Campylobacter avium TaxID=522485 RepID=UPI001D2C0F0A|nr:SLC13 family permease [Campylobacter avium]HJE65745.1 anion permease [Campylobacter avium]